MGIRSSNAKLYFFYGAMGSAKTAHLLINAFNCREKGLHPLVLTAAADTRGRVGEVSSRIGLKEEATPIGPSSDMFRFVSIINSSNKVDLVLADEVNLMAPRNVDDMARVVDELGITVMAYGLRADFRTRLFPASRRLMELADTIYELKTLCRCGRKAIVNARLKGGRILVRGPQILVGGNETYSPMCRRCWMEGQLDS